MQGWQVVMNGDHEEVAGDLIQNSVKLGRFTGRRPTVKFLGALTIVIGNPGQEDVAHELLKIGGAYHEFR